MGAPILYSVGHGSRSSEAFVELLEQCGVDCLVDVRAYPRSRRHPHFTRLALQGTLARHGVRYVWEGEDLGGLRRPRRDSPHTALDDVAFRGFADHMGSASFRAGIERVLALAAVRKTVLMCAETMPEHCHRGFVADALVAHGAQVLHLIGPGDTRGHGLHPAARCVNESLVYDKGRQLVLGL